MHDQYWRCIVQLPWSDGNSDLGGGFDVISRNPSFAAVIIRRFAKTKNTFSLAALRFGIFLWRMHSNHTPESTMKYTLLAIAVAMLAVSCKSTQPAPASPPMVDMGVRSGK